MDVCYGNNMHNTKQLAIDLHNEFEPEWDLDDTTEFVWTLQRNCFSEEDIRNWFSKLNVSKDLTAEIIVEEMPSEYIRDDWS